ncbi:MAG: hypothetical protein AAF558_09120 [Verrucomicrobiota bacterium]
MNLVLFFVRVFLVIIAAYLAPSIPLWPTKLFIPFFATFLLAVTCLYRIPNWKPVLYGGVACLFFSGFNLLTSIDATVPIVEHIKSILYFLFLAFSSLIIGSSIIFTPNTRNLVGHLLLAAGFGVIAFGALEQRTPLAKISDTYRDAAYGYGKTDNEKRDIKLTGDIRPKVFTREPSHAARGASMLFILGAIAITSHWKRFLALLAIGVCIAIFGSPVPAGFFLALICGAFIPASVKKRGLAMPFVAAMGVAGIAAIAALTIAIPSFADRVDTILEGRDASTKYRTTVVWSLALDALEINSVSGVGIGGEERLGSRAFLASRENATINTMINNALCSIPLFTGISGCIFFFAFFLFCLLRLPNQFYLFYGMVIFCLLFSTGAIHSSQTWSCGAILFAFIRNFYNSPTGSNVSTEPSAEDSKEPLLSS